MLVQVATFLASIGEVNGFHLNNLHSLTASSHKLKIINMYINIHKYIFRLIQRPYIIINFYVFVI
jgi:hypothetical protein